MHIRLHCPNSIVMQVCLLVIAKGYLKLALKISATMMRRGHIRETAQVSRYLVAAGHTDFKQCLTGMSGLRAPRLEAACKNDSNSHMTSFRIQLLFLPASPESAVCHMCMCMKLHNAHNTTIVTRRITRTAVA